MRHKLLMIQAMMALLLAAPLSYGQWRKAIAVQLPRMVEIKDNLKIDKERSTIQEAARIAVESSSNFASLMNNCGSQMTDDRKDGLISAGQDLKRAAESVRDNAKALMDKLEANGGPKSECEATSAAIDVLVSKANSFQQQVEEHRTWLRSQSSENESKVIDAIKSVIRYRDESETAAKKTDSLYQASKKAYEDLLASEAAHRDSTNKVNDVCARWINEKESDKKAELFNEMTGTITKNKETFEAVKNAEKTFAQSEFDLLQSQKDLRNAMDQHFKATAAMEEGIPKGKVIVGWCVDFDKEFK